MDETTLFKQVAAERLPESLYKQLEPYIKPMLNDYEVHKLMIDAMNNHKSRQLNARHHEIWDEFNEANKQMWPDFARNRWPEIEQFFNLNQLIEPSISIKKNDDLLGDALPF